MISKDAYLMIVNTKEDGEGEQEQHIYVLNYRPTDTDILKWIDFDIGLENSDQVSITAVPVMGPETFAALQDEDETPAA